MSANRVLFDAPGPRGRRRIRIFTAASILAAAGVVWFALDRLSDNGQLDGDRWRPFTTRVYRKVLLEGLEGTLRATAMAALFAFPIGIVLALLRLSSFRPLRWIATAYIELFRAFPLLLLIYAFLILLPNYDIDLPIFWKLVVPIVMVSSASIAEVVRAGVLALHRGQTEAGKAIGLSGSQVMAYVVLPQSMRLVLPALIAQLVTLLKESTLGYVVSYSELMHQGSVITARTHLLIQTYFVIAMIFVLINFALGRIAVFVERRLQRRVAVSRRRTGGAPSAPAADIGRVEAELSHAMLPNL